MLRRPGRKVASSSELGISFLIARQTGHFVTIFGEHVPST